MFSEIPGLKNSWLYFEFDFSVKLNNTSEGWVIHLKGEKKKKPNSPAAPDNILMDTQKFGKIDVKFPSISYLAVPNINNQGKAKYDNGLLEVTWSYNPETNEGITFNSLSNL